MSKMGLLAGVALAVFAVSASAGEPAKFGAWGYDTSGENRAVKPGDDFFGFANGTAVAKMVIPADMTSYGNFTELALQSQQRVHDILDQAAAHASLTPSDPIGKAGAFYKAFMNEAMAEKLGATPIAADLAEIRAIRTVHDFVVLQGGSVKNFQGSVLAMAINPDSKNTSDYSVELSQAGLGLPDRDYYLTAQFADKKAKYLAFIGQMLGLVGWQDPAGSAAKVMAFEQRIAEISWTKVQQRDPDAMYNPTSVAELTKAVPGFDWGAYLAAANLGKTRRVVLDEKPAILKIAALVAATPVDVLQDWAAFHLAIDAAPLLSKDFVNANFEFNEHELEGQPALKVRWKRGVTAVSAAMGDAIGQAYVATYFPPEARAQMQVLTHALRDAFHARLLKNSWMSPATKQQALEKLAAFDFQIGYPKKWHDYSGLVIRSDDLYGDAKRGTAFSWAFWLKHLGHKVDRDEWDMEPQEVDAYNSPNFNQVVFPAAILQPPFFDPKADPAINYGAIGGVIGHEMTHSFDDQGRKFDAHGRLHDWWTPEDSAKFDALAKKYGAQFAALEILPGAHINPALTMGENIADLGGLTLGLDAYHAFLKGKPAPVIDGYSGDQRVFLGWAQVWRQKLRDDAERERLVSDPHSPPIARVNMPMHNIDFWYSAWGVKPGDKLYLAPADRVKIW